MSIVDRIATDVAKVLHERHSVALSDLDRFESGADEGRATEVERIAVLLAPIFCGAETDPLSTAARRAFVRRATTGRVILRATEEARG